jgi:DNA-binding NarL/FixJ family response regulator
MTQLLKPTPAQETVDLIQVVHRETKVESAWQKRFTDRECEVLVQLAQGKNNREIAQTLYLTEGTVKNYISRILGQLELCNRTQAALWAQRQLIHSQDL